MAFFTCSIAKSIAASSGDRPWAVGIEHRTRVFADLVGNRIERGPFVAAMVFNCGANDAAGVRDEVGYAKDAIRVKVLLGPARERNVRPLNDQARFQSRHVLFAHDIRPRCGNPDLTLDVEHGVAR